MSKGLSDIPIIVLCGGLGIRLRPVVANRPKILAPISKKTLLDFIIVMLKQAGFEKIILSVGYLKEQIKKHAQKNGYDVIFSEEEEILGTGGALKAALRFVEEEQFFTMNGDMIFNPNFKKLYLFHKKRGGIMSMALTSRYIGSGGNIVNIDKAHRIIGWREKTERDQPEQFHLNAGTYLMNRAVSEFFPKREKFSLENDCFPFLFKQECYGFPTNESFIDIGIPERYEIALNMVGNGDILFPTAKYDNLSRL